MTYARARLLVGITGVGTIVLISLAALLFHLPHRYLAGVAAPLAVSLTLLVYILISLPFDLFGGFFFPRRYGRATIGFASFLKIWVRGVVWQSVVLFVCALAILYAARWGGTVAGVVCAGTLMFLLLQAQSAIARAVGGMRAVAIEGEGPFEQVRQWKIPLPKTVAYAARDPGFTGGLVGFPGHERLVVPEGWFAPAPPGVASQIAAVQISRRAGVLATGARLRGVALAIFWNLAGFALAAHFSHADLGEAAGLVNTALLFTLWSFLGLLLLPSLSRPGVFEADRYVRKRGVSAGLLAETIGTLDRLQDDEPARGKWIELIFHPIPSVTSRVVRLDARGGMLGAWHGARMALYLSWACCGFLSRAVHCNCGRPELWALLPGD